MTGDSGAWLHLAEIRAQGLVGDIGQESDCVVSGSMAARGLARGTGTAGGCGCAPGGRETKGSLLPFELAGNCHSSSLVCVQSPESVPSECSCICSSCCLHVPGMAESGGLCTQLWGPWMNVGC